MKYTIGIDIGGTKILAGLVDRSWRVLRSNRVPLDRHTPRRFLLSVQRALVPLVSPDVQAIGVGTTGVVNRRTGVVSGTGNLPRQWRHVQLKKILSEKFRLPVDVDNDGNCFALAEAVVGQGRDKKSILGITIGTGVGAGLVTGKRLYRGRDNVTEFGHTTVSTAPVKCSCGRTGHLESFVSGPAMTREYKRLTNRTCDPHEIEDYAKRGRRAAQRVFDQMARWLGLGLTNAIYSYNPDIIVLGGGLSAVRLLTIPAIRYCRTSLFYGTLASTKIVATRDRHAMPVIGAALLTQEKKIH
ncbi:MAG: ROK family protein [Patescibacteria group bacterium]